jgi:hypothetical protein
VVALAGDFNVFTARITTSIAAVLLSFRYFAKAWDMRALLHQRIHHNSSPSRTSKVDYTFAEALPVPVGDTFIRRRANALQTSW